MPERVSLARVYPIDFGRRTEDLPTWRKLTEGRWVFEVGCGDGRVAAACSEVTAWWGIDLDKDAVQAFRGRGLDARFFAMAGDAVDVARDLASRSHPPFDLAIIPFSTLFLIPHEKQAPLLRALLKLTNRVVVEVFALTEMNSQSGTRRDYRALRGPAGEDWVRTTRYDIDAEARITRALRSYGAPARDAVWEVEEVIYWRALEDVVELIPPPASHWIKHHAPGHVLIGWSMGA